ELLTNIWSDPLQWQELGIFKVKPAEIKHFSRVIDREESFERTGPETWKTSTGDGAVDQTDVQSLLNTLASLRAVRWVGMVKPEQGFEQAQLVVTFVTTAEPKVLHKLMIGGRTDNSMWFAQVEGRDGTFVISNPDFTALKLPLMKATPSAAPTPSMAGTTAGVSSSPMPAPSAAELTPSPR
ncbi:MAG: hypothetical protein ABIR29_07905, partial [Chthoniobacterales bacterium]